MDDIDRAGEEEDRARGEALRIARKRNALRPLGACYWCDEPVRGIFCNADCRDGWQRERDAEMRAGR